MRTLIHSKCNINLANYYAVELLEANYGNHNPSTVEISNLEKLLKKSSCAPYIHVEYTEKKRYLPKALILSSNAIEQNTLALMLSAKEMSADQIYTNQDLFKLFRKNPSYSIVIISEKFKSIGLNFLSLYFRSFKQKPFLIYLGNEFKSDHILMGFNAHLTHPFFTKDLLNILPSFHSSSST